jgi:hypothetical protein
LYFFIYLKEFESNYQQPIVVIEKEQEIISVEQRTVEIDRICFFFYYFENLII